jgi:Secretion system C-terminal sorting domain
MKTKIILLMLLILSSETKAWDSTAAKFYPLNIGDEYVYQRVQLILECFPVSSNKFKVTVVSDTILSNGKKYFIFSGFNWPFQRIDSSSMNVYSYQNGEDVLLDSLLGNSGDLFNGKRNPESIYPAVIFKTTRTIFNETKNAKVILNGVNNFGPYSYSLVEGFGLTDISNCLDFGESYELKGCIIKGVVYGDTTTGIRQISSTIPEKFSLEQNYPNPFNPKTIINYELPITNYVSLKVYDVLGKEVAALVSQKQNAGSYEVEFNGENFSSGIYFYKLEAGNFIETKRMILLK